MKPTLFPLLTLFGLLPGLALGVTMVEIKDPYGGSKIYVDGRKGRMETPNEESYIVIDGDHIYSVMPGQQTVMDMSGTPGSEPENGTRTSVKAKLLDQGAGPEIAGYPTRKYQIMANGRSCGELFASKAALKETGMEHVMKAMHRMARRAAAAAARFRGGADPCEAAEAQLMDRFTEIGLPLRSLDKAGQLESEVVRVVKGARLPPNAFGFPKHYKVQTMAQMEQRAAEQMRSQMPGGMPNMEELMKQMPQGGSIPPEAMEQMKQLKEMMQRYRQQ
ncbi:MAG: hypothetical protein Kow006_09430 [Gammaproteobacteria bacterium]